MILLLITVVDLVARFVFLILIIHIVLTYFMSPFHPIRQWVDRFIEPMLNPIRHFVPPIGMVDFSPLILILVIQVISYILKSVLRSLL